MNKAASLILVADDDLITRLAIQNILQKAGYQADLAVNGQDAISALEAGHYDLVVIDCNMPLMDGLEAAAHIRNAVSGRIDTTMPIIAITGSTSEAEKQRCLDAGMDACISKPVDATTLIDAIRQYLGGGAAANPDSQQDGPRDERPFGDEFLDTLIANFLEELPQLVTALQRAARQEDLDGLKDLAHRLRGPSGILEFSTLSALAESLEHAGAEKDPALAGRLTAELVGELNRLAAALAG